MIKNSLKYLTIVAVNLITLTLLLALWTDKLERTINDFVRPIEFLKILGFTALSLIGIRLLVAYFRKKNIYSVKSKIKIAVILTFLISSYLYIGYTWKVFNNRILNGQFRTQISNKIKPSNQLACGTMADSLTVSEYQQISKMNWFPELPKEARNINYLYGYDGFLPDYIFTLTYDLPLEVKVDTMIYTKGDFNSYRTFKIINGLKRVTYSEGER